MDARSKNAIFEPTMVLVPSGAEQVGQNYVQISAHSVTSKPFLRETAYVFPDKELSGLVVIHTMQQAKVELVRIGDDVETEKDRLILSFFAVAQYLRSKLESFGPYWVDYIDPCSGLPVCSEGQNMFNEVECAQTLLGYSVMNAGCCKIILHPQWGSAVYPASIFTTAPAELVLEVLRGLQPSAPASTVEASRNNMADENAVSGEDTTC